IDEYNHYNIVEQGSLDDIKRFNLLKEAIHILVLKGMTDIKLYINGDNRESGIDYKKYLFELIHQKALTGYVNLLGFKSNPYPYLLRCDGFVLSSRKEGFPNVVLEALVLNRPCLVTNCVDFKGIIDDGVNGLIVEKNSASELARGIEVLREKALKGRDMKFENFDYNKWFYNIT